MPRDLVGARVAHGRRNEVREPMGPGARGVVEFRPRHGDVIAVVGDVEVAVVAVGDVEVIGPEMVDRVLYVEGVTAGLVARGDARSLHREIANDDVAYALDDQKMIRRTGGRHELGAREADDALVGA